MLRELMIQEMREEIGNPNGSSRYGCYFYLPKEEVTRRERKFNARAREANLIDINTLANLSAVELLDAYRKYQRRYNTWM